MKKTVFFCIGLTISASLFAATGSNTKKTSKAKTTVTKTASTKKSASTSKNANAKKETKANIPSIAAASTIRIPKIKEILVLKQNQKKVQSIVKILKVTLQKIKIHQVKKLKKVQ